MERQLVRLAVFALVAVLAFAGAKIVVKSAKAAFANPEARAFVEGCTKAGASKSKCNCMYAWIHKNVPEAEYKAYSRALDSNYAQAMAAPPPWLREGVDACRWVA